jgi:hypothetical protein
MKRIFLKQSQNPIKIGVLSSAKTNGGEISMKSKFKNLIADYAFHGCKIKELDRDRLFALTLAYLEDKFAGSSGSSCPNSLIEIPMNIGMLYKLNSNIYNHQRALLEDIKDAIMANQISDVSEKLDEEKEAMNKMLGDDYGNYRNNILILLSAAKKQGVAYDR